jgi:methyl coenzyme M reductase subunit C-like uncharacterized protein (methanogenesis marker protein 7)
MVVKRRIEEQIQPFRRVVNQQPVIAQLDRLAAAAALGRAEQVIEIRPVI